MIYFRMEKMLFGAEAEGEYGEDRWKSLEESTGI